MGVSCLMSVTFLEYSTNLEQTKQNKQTRYWRPKDWKCLLVGKSILELWLSLDILHKTDYTDYTNLDLLVVEFGNALTTTWQTEVLYYLFWSILSQMRYVCCQNSPPPKKKVPTCVCSMAKFPWQLYWIEFCILQVKICILGSYN